MFEHVENSSWNSFIPHGQSYSWDPSILLLDTSSSVLVALSIFSMGLTLAYFLITNRKKVQFHGLYILFFILALVFGASAIFDVLVTWVPLYRYQAYLKIAVAGVSVLSALFLWPLMWKIFAAPSGQLLEQKSKELESTNDKYNLLLAGSRIGVYEWTDFKDLKKPIFWSERMFELLGFKPQSFEPTLEFFLTLVHPEDRGSASRFLKPTQDSSNAEPVEYRIRVLDQYRWFRFRNVVKLDEEGKGLFAVGSIEDIHDQKMAEEKILSMNGILEDEIQKRTRQLEIANHAKTRFLANMSHEMRTPLGLVLGFSELLIENRSLDSDAQEYVNLIIKNGEILSRVINDLLDLSKIEAGKMRFQYSKFPLKQLIEDFDKAFGEKAAQKGLRLTFQNLCSDSDVVVTDEIRLKQVVYNLLSNAIKFTDQGNITVTLGKRDSIYYIDVVDSGIGIPDYEKDRIFDEFARGEIAESGKRAGTGLGLRLAQNLAQALGGGVELVSSHVGKGSHFRLTFQSDEERLQRQVERRQEATLSSKLNDFEVFVLDDNEDNIRLAEIFLKKLGCRVRGFNTAKSLFAEMVSAEPDLILLDINMPEMNGFEVFDRLRQSGYKNPIWALTAYSLNEDIQAILDHGFDDYVRKPMSLESMKRKLTFELRERSHD